MTTHDTIKRTQSKLTPEHKAQLKPWEQQLLKRKESPMTTDRLTAIREALNIAWHNRRSEGETGEVFINALAHLDALEAKAVDVELLESMHQNRNLVSGNYEYQRGFLDCLEELKAIIRT